MKPTPTFKIASPIWEAVKSKLTPAASKTSALPLLLEAPRLPCLATLAPAAAATKAEAVETLNLLEPLPPVPHVSTKFDLFTSTTTLVDSLRITETPPKISDTFIPFICSPTKKAAFCASVVLPVIISVITDTISSNLRSWCSVTVFIASTIFITIY